MLLDYFTKPYRFGISSYGELSQDDSEAIVSVQINTGLFNLHKNDYLSWDDCQDIAGFPDRVFREFLSMVSLRVFPFSIYHVSAADYYETEISPVFSNFIITSSSLGQLSLSGGNVFSVKDGYGNWLNSLYQSEYSGANVFDDVIAPSCMNKKYAIPLVRYGDWDCFSQYRSAIDSSPAGTDDLYLNSLRDNGYPVGGLVSLLNNFTNNANYGTQDSRLDVSISFDMRFPVSSYAQNDYIIIRYADCFANGCSFTDREIIAFVVPAALSGQSNWYYLPDTQRRIDGITAGMTYNIVSSLNGIDISLDITNASIRNNHIVHFEIPIERIRPALPPQPVTSINVHTPSNVKSMKADCGFTIDTPDTFLKAGLCYGTSPLPDITIDSYIEVISSSFTGIESRTVTLSSLSYGTHYYIRAYAIDSDNNVIYSTVEEFTTSIPVWFSVANAGQVQKVVFAPGNLQYHCLNNEWRFAPNQYDALLQDNENIANTFDGWIDLFGYGTSGWNSGVSAYMPYSASVSSSDYIWQYFTGQYTRCDWGIYNSIYNPKTNSTDPPSTWNVFLDSYISYMMNSRPASTVGNTPNARYVKCTVNGVPGMIVFPDIYTHPANVPVPSSINVNVVQYSDNVYSISEWEEMENAGCIFFPASGYRNGTVFNDSTAYGPVGRYWTGQPSNGVGKSRYFNFDQANLNPANNDFTYYGFAVRLIKKWSE